MLCHCLFLTASIQPSYHILSINLHYNCIFCGMFALIEGRSDACTHMSALVLPTNGFKQKGRRKLRGEEQEEKVERRRYRAIYRRSAKWIKLCWRGIEKDSRSWMLKLKFCWRKLKNEWRTDACNDHWVRLRRAWKERMEVMQRERRNYLQRSADWKRCWAKRLWRRCCFIMRIASNGSIIFSVYEAATPPECDMLPQQLESSLRPIKYVGIDFRK